MKLKIEELNGVVVELQHIKRELLVGNEYLKKTIESTKSDDYEELLKRIAEVEVKISKMWDLLITKSPVTKEDKPSSYAKKHFMRNMIK